MNRWNLSQVFATCLFPLYFASGSALAESPVSPKGSVLLILYTDAFENHASTLSAVQAGIGDLDIDLKIVWRDTSPSTKQESENLAREYIEEVGAAMGIWCDGTLPRDIHLIVRNSKNNQVQTRALDAASQESAMESLALIIRSWVTTFITGQDAPATDSGDAEEENTTPEVVNDTENKTDKKDDDVSDEQPEMPVPIITFSQRTKLVTGTRRLILEAAGAIRVQSASQGIYGGDFVVGGRVFHELVLFAGISFYTPSQDVGSSVTLEIRRYPIKLGGRFLVPLGRVALGPSLAVEIDPIIKDLVNYDTTQIDPNNMDTVWEVSIVPMVSLTVLLWRPIHLLLGAGAEVLLNERTFSMVTANGENVTLHDPYAVQATFYLGLLFVML